MKVIRLSTTKVFMKVGRSIIKNVEVSWSINKNVEVQRAYKCVVAEQPKNM